MKVYFYTLVLLIGCNTALGQKSENATHNGVEPSRIHESEKTRQNLDSNNVVISSENNNSIFLNSQSAGDVRSIENNEQPLIQKNNSEEVMPIIDKKKKGNL
jgi:hypothetical protein